MEISPDATEWTTRGSGDADNGEFQSRSALIAVEQARAIPPCERGQGPQALGVVLAG